ncbi:MAG: SGNH/GDSL hydrolase family protein [Salibacteraceae bacterium]
MKSATATNRPVLFLIALLAFSASPWWLSWLEIPFPDRIEMHLYVLTGVLWLVLLGMSRLKVALPRRLLNLSISGITLLLCGYLLLGIDRWMAPDHPGYLFPPGSAVRYTTSEFDVTAHINSMGIRDREFSMKKTPGKKRSLVFGDSFTFGWGVALEATWLKLWEADLNRTLGPTEVLYFGQSGRWTQDFLRVAQLAVPELKPDVVVVAYYQGNDLFQAMEHEQPREGVAFDAQPPVYIWQPLQKLLPNLLNPLAATRSEEPLKITPTWLVEATFLLDNYSPEQQERYARFPNPVKHHFERGKLNPGVVDGAIRQSERYAEMNDPQSSRARAGREKVMRDLQAIKALAEKQGATLRVVVVPHRTYLSSKDRAFEVKDLGMAAPPEVPWEAQPSFWEPLEGVPVYWNHSTLAKRAERSKLYFTLDGHFTREGNRAFADWLSTQWQPLR